MPAEPLEAAKPVGRLVYADALRVFAILMVVVLHTSARALTKSPAFGEVWWAGNLFDSLSRWSVPVFVMLSGALLLSAPRSEGLGFFLRRRFSKIVLPFLVWSTVYLLFRWLLLKEPLTLGHILPAFLHEPAFYHLWFMYVILGLYLITPLLRSWLKQASNQDLQYFFCLWVLFVSFLPMSKHLWGLDLGIQLEFLTGYAGYFVLGYYLHQQKSLPTPWLWGAFISGAMLTVGGTWFLTLKKQGHLDQALFSYFSPNVLLMSVGVYGLFKGSQRLGEGQIPRWLLGLSQSSFGIYLCHPLLLAVALNTTTMNQFKLENVLLAAWWGIPLCSVLVFGLSLGLVLLLRKVPLLKATVP
ncbi:MAG: acyltransferase [Candidatus Sericytochromatia bacterium]